MGWRHAMRAAALVAGGALISISGAVANDFPLRCDTKPSKVCARWAPGAPGTFAGECVQWKWVRAQCASMGRESWQPSETKLKKH